MRTILAMLAALPLLAAGPGNTQFSGRIFDATGVNHLANAIVTVSTPAGYVSSVTTDKSGEFSFKALPEGEYDFRVTAHGFAIFEREVTISAEAGVRQLDIRMLVPANKQTVSVAELQKLDVTGVGGYSESAHRGY